MDTCRARWFGMLTGLTLLAATGCFADRPLSFARASVSIRKVEAFEAPSAMRASVVLTPGDFVIEGNGLHVVVGGLDRAGDSRGAVLEATRDGVPAAESIVLLSPMIYVGGVPRRIRVDRMFIVAREKQPTLRIEGAVWIQERVVSFARELTLGRVAGTLSISTRLLTLNPDGEKDVRVGARIAWGGPQPFMPGVGVVEDQSFHRGEILSAEGATGSSTFGFVDNALSARAQYEDRAHGEALLHTDVVEVSGHDLLSAKPFYARSVLAVAPGGVSVTVRAFGFARGRPFEEVWASVPYHPEGTEVSLTDDAAKPWMVGRPDAEGRVVLPVVPVEGHTPKEGFLVASAYGHASSDRTMVNLADERPAIVLRIPHGGRIRLHATDAVTNGPIPVRMRLLPLEGTAPLELGPDYRASGARDTVIAVRGEAEVVVPSGRYRSIVTHGTEWSLHEAEIDVTETYSPRVDAVLRHEVDPGEWIAADLHVHAEPSPDSEVSLQDRLASLQAEGIRFVAPTDHDLITDYQPTVSELGIDMLTLPGIEITSVEPVLGHFNAFPIPRDITRPGNGAPSQINVQLQALFSELHARDPDLIIQINHPRMEGGIGYFDAMSYDTETGAADPRFSAEFDAMEVFNGFDLARPANVERVFQDWLAVLARGQRVVATGSSDTHQVRYQLAGYPRTYIRVAEAEASEPRATVRALKAGRAFVSSGPFVEASIGTAGPGAMATAQEGKVSLQVTVRAPDWMPVERLEVFVDRTRVFDRAIPKLTKAKRARAAAPRLVQTFELALTADAFVVVRVSSATAIGDFFGRQSVLPLAFTNPIFVDFDGDGKTPWTSPPIKAVPVPVPVPVPIMDEPMPSDGPDARANLPPSTTASKVASDAGNPPKSSAPSEIRATSGAGVEPANAPGSVAPLK